MIPADRTAWLYNRISTFIAPPLVLLENVTTFLTSHGGADFHNALLALNGLGNAVDTFVLDAA